MSVTRYEKTKILKCLIIEFASEKRYSKLFVSYFFHIKEDEVYIE